MSIPIRSVVAEVLDGLDADDPRAQRSRRDLQRVNLVMRSASIMARAIKELDLAVQPHRIIELGAGDGTLLLSLAGARRPRWTDVDLTLLDRLDLVSHQTREAYRALGWRVTVEPIDALAWGASERYPRFDLCLANLFLHHFAAPQLAALLDGIAASSNAFVACEPRRNTFARLGSQMVGLLGTNVVTREDAVTSVAAGFNGHELSTSWNRESGDWVLDEYLALPFTHCFAAVRASVQAARVGRDS